MEKINRQLEFLSSEELRFKKRQSQIGCILCIVLVPFGFTLDSFVYPEFVSSFLGLRFGVAGIILVIFLLHFSARDNKRVSILLYTWITVVQAAICYMIYTAEGWNSTYYAGLNLVILAIGVLLPLTLLEALLFCGATLFMYFGAGLLQENRVFELSTLYNNVYFILLTSIISVTAAYCSTKHRREQYLLQFRLNQSLNALQDELLESKKTLSVMDVMNQYHHDIKVPLAIIDGVVSTDIYDKEKQRDIVLEQIQRGTRLIATMAAILKGKRKRENKHVNLEDILRESLFMFEKRFHTIDFNVKPVLPIIGDAIDLKILFVNIIKNASEAVADDGVASLSVAIWSADSTVNVSLKDNGMGMPNFKAGMTWDKLPSSKEKGSGIGLQAVKRIADEHGATVVLNSFPGAGCEFIFQFPVAEQNALAG